MGFLAYSAKPTGGKSRLMIKGFSTQYRKLWQRFWACGGGWRLKLSLFTRNRPQKVEESFEIFTRLLNAIPNWTSTKLLVQFDLQKLLRTRIAISLMFKLQRSKINWNGKRKNYKDFSSRSKKLSELFLILFSCLILRMLVGFLRVSSRFLDDVVCWWIFENTKFRMLKVKVFQLL
jgi:hypothetical protein